jgi:uncharacterized membrane protein
MPHSLRNTILCVSVLLVGLLAGLQWGTGMAQYTALSLPGPVWLLRHQAEDALFRQVMPGYMWAVLLSLAISAIVSRGKTRAFFLLAAVFSLVQMIVTIAHEVPINRIVANWSPTNLPAEWDATRHRWMMGHWLRTGLSFVAFLCATLGLWRSDPVERLPG